MIEVRDVTKMYRMGEVEVHALRGVSLEIEQGDFVTIMGPSGSGKSTLMNVLGCLDTPTAGSYHLHGRDVSRLSDGQLAHIRNQEIGFVFQMFNLLPRTQAIRQPGPEGAEEHRRRKLHGRGPPPLEHGPGQQHGTAGQGPETGVAKRSRSAKQTAHVHGHSLRRARCGRPEPAAQACVRLGSAGPRRCYSAGARPSVRS